MISTNLFLTNTMDRINTENSTSLAIKNHHLIKKHYIPYLNKLDSKELFSIHFLVNFLKPTSLAYFENVFERHVFE